MAGPFYLVASDLDLSASTVTSGSSQTNFPIANIHDEAVWRPWKSDVTTTNQQVAVDYGSAIGTPTSAWIMNHNLPSAGTYRIQSASNSGFSSDLTTLATFTFRATDMFVKWSAGTARQFVRLALVDSDGASGSFTNKPQIGQLIWGDHTQLTRMFSWGGGFSERYNNLQGVTNSGHIWSLEVNEHKEWVVEFEDLSIAELAEMSTLYAASKGNHIPFPWAPDPDSGTTSIAAECYYVRTSPILEWRDGPIKQVSGIRFVEESRETSLT